jgi:hypothetical protein
MAKRVRPEDDGIVWLPQFNAFICYGCMQYEEVHAASRRTPEKLAELREFLALDHTECWEFDDPRMAADARKFRSEKKRRELLKRRAGAALDRQAVSWRGRT